MNLLLHQLNLELHVQETKSLSLTLMVDTVKPAPVDKKLVQMEQLAFAHQVQP